MNYLIWLALLTSDHLIAGGLWESPDSIERNQREILGLLTSDCPPGYELSQQNTCKFFHQYQTYPSILDRGIGGTRTGLPSFRDGFSPALIDLGRHLFFDPILSPNQTISCSSCHDPDHGFADPGAHSIGISRQPLDRNAPSLWNLGFLNRFNWDGSAVTLETQILGPLYNPQEMGNTKENLVHRLNTSEAYRFLFAKVYEKDPDRFEISEKHIITALTAFQSTLISLNSRYDRYVHGHHESLSTEEIRGLNVFRSFVARCSECHTPPLFTNQQMAVIGAPERKGLTFDHGAELVFGSKRLKGGFKVPTLRNITKTAPYMHSGGFQDLSEVLAFYNEGRAAKEGRGLYLHWHITSPDLAKSELADLKSFLNALEDESFKPKRPNITISKLILNNERRGVTKQ
ncbi:MAG: cytochrome-c peroxidase [Pseudobacteriovorax sp.]|nr:cytochrome-c peroxidase [Pseudobacteriovorax sp.]